jgi:hypothetical protein
MTIRTTIAWVLFAMSPAALLGQSIDPRLTAAVIESEKARQAGNAAAWAEYVADDAIFIGVGGTIENKAQRVSKAAAPLSRPGEKISEERYRLYGDVVIRTWRVDGTRSDRRTAVWVNQKGRWKLASLQITVVE